MYASAAVTAAVLAVNAGTFETSNELGAYAATREGYVTVDPFTSAFVLTPKGAELADYAAWGEVTHEYTDLAAFDPSKLS